MATRPDHQLDAAIDKRRIMVRFVRMAFFILITTVSLVTFLQRVSDHGADQPPLTVRTPGAGGDRPSASTSVRSSLPPTLPEQMEIRWWVPVVTALILFGIVLLIDVATPNKKISSISAVIFGLLAGILATVAISAVIELALRVWLPDAALRTIEPFIQVIKPLLGIALCYLGITTILQTQDDFRLVIPYVEFAKQIRGTKPMILDTSALIDARVADVAATGLMQAPIIIPRFVVAELQLLADSSDKLKRARGRRGLDVVTRLQRQGTLDVSVDETPVSSMAVDQALVELATQLSARLVTTDLGLTRVAQIHGVVVVNMHEVAGALKPALIPGQTLSIRLVKPGEQGGQAVGYLDDGTMVVAEAAAHMIGQDTQVLVTSTIQTTAGRMVFARPIDGPPYEGPVGGRGEGDAGQGSTMMPAADVGRAVETASDPLAVATPASAPVMGHGGVGIDVVEATEGIPGAPGAPPVARPGGLGAGGVGGVGGVGGGGGPFPPKPPARRPPSPRNPRR